MANKIRGEITAELDGKSWTLCLTLGALANLESVLGVDNLSLLTEKFSNGTLRTSDIIEIISAGLQGGGHDISVEEVATMKVTGGINGYIAIVTQLLEATFTPIKSEDV